jgi:hypothetical protein
MADNIVAVQVTADTSDFDAGMAKAAQTAQNTFAAIQQAAAGDAFQIYPGCDKTLSSNGCAKFANTARFWGSPYVPVPETAV